MLCHYDYTFVPDVSNFRHVHKWKKLFIMDLSGIIMILMLKLLGGVKLVNISIIMYWLYVMTVLRQ